MKIQILLRDADSELVEDVLIDDDNLADYDLTKSFARSSIMNDIETALHNLKIRIEEL